MIRLAAVLALALIAPLERPARATQAPPNLSGTWRPQNVPALPAGMPYEITITEASGGVTIRSAGQSPETVTVAIGAPDGRGAGPGGAAVANGRWDNRRLLVPMTMAPGRGQAAGTTITNAYSIEGDRLTLEASSINPDGSATPPRTVVYVRAKLDPLPAPPTRQLEAGYVSLFNGKDLTGWRTAGPATAFTVDRGAIVANGPTQYLFYDGPVGAHRWGNYSLRLDVAARFRSNGGIWILTEFQPQGHPAKGFEVQVNNSHTDRIRTGSLYHVVDLSHIPAVDDEWYPMEIVVRGETITISVKGDEVVRWTQPKGWAGSYDFAERRIAPGTIALQAHDPVSVTAYANLRIRLLD